MRSFSFAEKGVEAQAGGHAALSHEPSQRVPGGHEGRIRGGKKKKQQHRKT